MTITESIKFNKLKEENEVLKKELAEKDKEHKEQLKRMYEQFKHDKELEIGQYKFEVEKQQLYKEDFEKVICFWDFSCCDNGITFYLKDNSKYDLLKSKENK